MSVQKTACDSDYAECIKLINMMVGAFGIKGLENDAPAMKLEHCLHRIQEFRSILRQLNKYFA